jgi:amino acid adenylation domain-containing protein
MTVTPQPADFAAAEEDCQTRAAPRKLVRTGEASTLSPEQGAAVLELLSSLRAHGIEIEPMGDLLRVSAPAGALGEDVRARIRGTKAELLAFLSAPGTRDAATEGPIRRASRSTDRDAIPLTHAQQRLWILHQLQPEATVYNLPYAFQIDGALDADALTASLRHLVERHEALRTTFVRDAQGAPVQRIEPTSTLRIDRFDLRAEPGRLTAILEREARRPFDLARGPLVRAAIFTVSDTRHVLFFNIHHIVCDGWSIEIFLDELVTLYDAASRGTAPPLPPLPPGFGDFALWEKDNVTPERMADALAFFRAQMAGAPEALELPTDRPRGGVFSYRGGSHRFSLDPELVQALTALGQRHQATPFMVMLAAFYVLLARSTGQKDLVVGSPVAGRQEPGTEGVIGFFVNTIVLRANLADDPTFTELLARVRTACLSAYEHQGLPFQWLVEALSPARDRSRTALYQAMFTFQDARQRRMDRGRLRWTRLEGLDAGGAKTDLTLLFEQHATAGSTNLIGWFEFNTDLFDRQTIERLAMDYETLLRSVVAHPGRPVARLELLHADTRAALRALNATRRPMPEVGGFHELIAAQTRRTPAAIAVVDRSESLTYLALAGRVHRLANHLIGLGVGPGSRVGVAVSRGTRLLQATLAILEVGAAYVPLDPDFPAERLDHMLKDAALTLVISEEPLRDRLPAGGHRILWLDRDAAAIGAAPATDPGVPVASTDAAYVIYTSGSTGRPKGVVIPHGAVVNFLSSMAAEPGLGPGDVLMAVTTLSFDIAVLELFGPLCVGARTIIADRDTTTDGARLSRLIAEHDATILQATPVTWQLLLDAGWTGKPGFKALCGGEAFPVPLARELLARCGSVWNMYGPTETCVWSTCARVTDASATILIGKPIANTELHVLDAHLQPVPLGVTGELYIGGRGVALGYLNRPELTAERFVPDPFSEDPGARMYRTGDLVRQRLDGVLYVGRVDNQIKLRGHRIELGEIEAVFDGDPAVSRSAVVVRDFGAGDARIVAYVVGVEGGGASAGVDVDVDRLRQRARDRLPDYMVPQHIEVLTALPLTPNGKIDRKALPEPRVSPSGTGHDHLVPPANALEELLVRLWCQTLRRERVGVTDNFFDLGGHSLLAVRLVQLIADACRINLSLAIIFKAPTIREQARAIDGGHLAEGISVVPLEPRGEREPLFCICGINLYQHLARNLDANRPVFGVFLPVEGAVLSGDGGEIGVRDMAAEYVKAIRAQQPQGPYHLVGVSFGGVLAYETAQQLRAAGEEVGILAILDVVLPGGLDFSWRLWAREHLGRVRQEGAPYALAQLGEWREKAATWLDHRAPRLPAVAAGLSARLRSALRPGPRGRPDRGPSSRSEPGDHEKKLQQDIESLHRVRLDQYRAAWERYERTLVPYPGTALIFRARDEKRPPGTAVRADCGWSRFIAADRMTLREVRGDHLGILTEPSVRELAQAIRSHLGHAAK